MTETYPIFRGAIEEPFVETCHSFGRLGWDPNSIDSPLTFRRRLDAAAERAVTLLAHMPKVKFVVEHLQVEVEAGRRLRAIALDAGVYPNREFLRGVNCGGRGICGTCKVWVHPASDRAVNAPNTREKIHGAGGGRRLACQTQVLGDVEVTTMPGGDDRLDPKRKIGPAPAPVQDADAVRKPIDEASSIAWPLGHPSKVGSGKMPESAPEESVKSVSKPVASKVSAPTDKPAESKSEPATDTSVGTKPSELVSQSGESNGERAASAAAAGKGDEPAGS